MNAATKAVALQSSNAEVVSTGPHERIAPRRTAGDSGRPREPVALVDWLATIAPARERAWDANSDGGRVAEALAGRFEHVVESDLALDRMVGTPTGSGIDRLVARASNAPLARGSLDLVVVGEWAHMLDMPAFAVEARRITRREGILAAWCYGLPRVAAAVDRETGALYNGKLGPYWPPERDLVDTGYRELHFPFRELTTPGFELVERWTVSRFLDYVASWPAYRHYLETRGRDPLAEYAPRLSDAWGDGVRTVRWPIHLRVGIPNP